MTVLRLWLLMTTGLLALAAFPGLADAAPQWRLLNTGPAKSGAAAQYDHDAKQVYVTGGRNATTVLSTASRIVNTSTCNDISQPLPSLPVARHGHSMIFDAASNRLILLGGAKDLAATELVLDVVSLTLTDTLWVAFNDLPDPNAPSGLGKPCPRMNATAVLAPGPKLLWFGGKDSQFSRQDTWELDLNTRIWKMLEPTNVDPLPAPQYSVGYQCPEYDGSSVPETLPTLMQSPSWAWNGGSAFLFGGRKVGGDALNELWEFVEEDWKWSYKTPSPLPSSWPLKRFEHVSVTNKDDRLIVYGGAYESGSGQIVDRGDVWAYEPVSETWSQLAPTGTAPSARRGAAAAYSKHLDRMIINGGVSGSGTYPAEIWELSFSDEIPPTTIEDIDWSNRSSCSIVLSWSAPADDCTVGAASSYDFRYSPSPITESNFDQAISVVVDPPGSPGSVQCGVVDGLAPMTTYHFAVKAIDEAGNKSAFGGAISVATTSGQCLFFICDIMKTAPVVAEAGATRLLPAAPNPSRDRVALSYRVSSEQQGLPLEMSVFDVRGAKVRWLRREAAKSGEHQVEWDFRSDFGERVPPGMYMVRMVIGSFTATQTVIALSGDREP